MRYINIFIISAIFLLSAACGQGGEINESQLETLHKEVHALYCERQQLQQKTETMWDDVAQALKEDLPSTLKQQERSNIVKVKNASLIRMFEVYPQLDTTIHNMVDSAELNDQRFAQQLTSLQEKLFEKEEEVMAALEEVQQQSPQAYTQWQQKFETVKKQPCATSEQ